MSHPFLCSQSTTFSVIDHKSQVDRLLVFLPQMRDAFRKLIDLRMLGMPALMHLDPVSVDAALRRLGLSTGPFLEALKQGYLARIDCTQNHPPYYASTAAWAETVRGLRDQLTPFGWIRDDPNGCPLTIHPSGGIAISVATGNEITGTPMDGVATKNQRGATMAEALLDNVQMTFPGFELPAPSFSKKDKSLTTWVFLINHAEKELRGELSLPIGLGSDERITAWRERILLPALPLDDEPFEIRPPEQPDIDVKIRRKV